MNLFIGIGIVISLIGLYFKIKKYYAPYDAHLSATEVRIRNLLKPEINIRNDGPGSALEVKVKCKRKNVKSIKKILGYHIIWFKIESIIGDGPSNLKKDESSFFMFDDGDIFDYTIVIKCKSIKSRYQTSFWKIRNGNKIKIIQTNSFINFFYIVTTSLNYILPLLKKSKLI